MELDTPDGEQIARAQHDAVDALAVDQRAVRAAEVFDDELIGLVGREAAVDARDERGVDDEIGARGAADRLDAPGRQPQRDRRLVAALQYPSRSHAPAPTTSRARG